MEVVGSYTSDFFRIADPGHRGPDACGLDDVTQAGAPCFCRGTLILTDTGEVPVEQLQIGDLLVTGSGPSRPIRWIGRRTYRGRFAAGGPEVRPVLIRRGALADATPRRDLYVSPSHALYLDGVLIPAVALVNGASILRADAIDEVGYFHVELETHDIIFAEGAAAETFVDDLSRGAFQNAAEYRALYPDLPVLPARFCAPRVEDGELLEAVRARLAALPAALAAAGGPPPGKLLGRLERVSRDRVVGWALDEAVPTRRVRLRVLDNGLAIGETVANLYREDLAAAGLGDGSHGFSLLLPEGFAPDIRHVIDVVRAEDACALRGGPLLLKPVDPAPALPAAPVAPPRLQAVTLAPPAWQGQIDEVTRERIEGWAWDRRTPDTAMALRVLVDGAVVARVVANRHRPDLAAAGIGDGRHAFSLVFPGGLPPLVRHVVRVQSEADGAEMPGSPVVIEASGGFDAALRHTVAGALGGLLVGEEQEQALSFLATQADRLRQLHADAHSERAERRLQLQTRRLADIFGPDEAGSSKEESARVLEKALADARPAPRLRALVIAEEWPAVGRDAASQVLLSHMRALRRLGYAVSFVAGQDLDAPEAICAALEDEGVTCCRAPFTASVEEVLRRQAGCFDVVYLHRIGMASRYLALARGYCPKARVLFCAADLAHLRLARQAEIEARPDLLSESRRLRLAECTAAWSADAVLTHSQAEAAMLRELVPDAHVHVAPWVVPVRPGARRRAHRVGADRTAIAFIADYAAAANVDAARFLVEEIMPLIWRDDDGIGCLLVGSRMPDAVRRLAGTDLSHQGVTVIGEVEDLTEVFDRVRLTVAPMRFGAGVMGKVLTSLAAGVPCVMSPIAAAGIDLPALISGASAAELAATIRRLHTDSAAHVAAAESGLAFIRATCTESRVDAALRAAITGREAALLAQAS